jgi:mTERF domain-containing protein
MENHIVPTYELVYRFLQSDKDIVASAMGYPALICEHRVPHNITLLVENGVRDSSIARLLRTNSRVFLKRGGIKEFWV